MLKINNIVKNFGTKENKKQVLKGINIEIKEGEIYGLIGANGAGKTTLMNIISQMITPTSGTIEINGKVIKSLNELCGQVGYMIDIPAMHEFLTPLEYFEFLAAPQKISKEELLKKSRELLEDVGLINVEKKQIKNFSRGMKQRMGIAAGLITNPKIILMDEPSSALDPQGRFEVIEIIRKLAQSGKTIILSTHILADVERVCTRIGLLVNGNIVIEGTIKNVLDNFNENAFRVECEKSDIVKIKELAEKLPDVLAVEDDLNGVTIYYKEGSKKKIFKAISTFNADIDSVMLKRPSIEEIFLKASRGEFANKQIIIKENKQINELAKKPVAKVEQDKEIKKPVAKVEQKIASTAKKNKGSNTK